MIRDRYFDLLKTWCETLLELQISGTGNVRFDGAFLCPSCLCIHGRSYDGVYPLLYMADATKEERYLNGALALFDWGQNLICDDGSFYNDAQSEWNGITVFAVIGIYDSLKHHGNLLTETVKKRFEDRMRMGADWIHRTITVDFQTNINYHASAAAALELVGIYDGNQEYRKYAAQLAKSCAAHILNEGYLYGEGKPMEAVTNRGCRPVDIGYNAEESIPSLLTYARAAGDEDMLRDIKELLMKQLDFMLPDGAWDNSFGTRNFKWTYWGSRTSDGCQTAYGMWGQDDRILAEAARRNLELLWQCTHEGLLYGGPDYYVHGEKPCIHHTFCHGKALAAVLDHHVEETMGTTVPAEEKQGFFYYPTTDTYKIYKGGWIGTVTGYDFEYLKGGHASGGTLSMLWHKMTGPVLLSSMVDYSMHEAHNMQLSLNKASHQSLTPRVEMVEGGRVFAQCYDYDSRIEVSEEMSHVIIKVMAELVDADHRSAAVPVFCELQYLFMEDKLHIYGEIKGGSGADVKMVLPVIGRTLHGYKKGEQGFVIPRNEGEIKLSVEGVCEEPEPIFYLAGGFEAWKFKVAPLVDSSFRIELCLSGYESF